MTSPLRLLACGHSYVLSMNRAILRALAEDTQFEITVAAPRHFHGDLRPIDIEKEPPGSKLRIVGLGASLTRWIHVFRYNARDLRNLMQAGRFDIVHAWEEPYIYAGYQLARAATATSARFCFRTAQNQIKRYPPPFSVFERDVVSRADGWIAGGQLVYDAMCRKGFPAHTGRILTLSVDTTAFRPMDRAERTKVRESLGIAGPVIGFLGRFTEAKGVNVLLEAVSALPPSTRWHLLMMGSGPLDSRIRDWAAAHGWSDRVTVRLFAHDEVPRVLPVVDVLAAPSQTVANWKEQFGRMTIEAFAAGVPIVASDSGEIPRVVGDAGLIVGERDIPAWTRALQNVLEDVDQRATMRERGLARAELYSSRTIARQFAGFYRALAARQLDSQGDAGLRR